ncbi:MAG: diphthamide synthesis protein [Candidatus Pacearchaeota archaeon]
MKILYIPARQKIFISKETIEEIAKKLPKKVGLVTTIQFSHLLKKFYFIFKEKGKKVFVYREGIILGCKLDAALKLQDKVSCFLYIGSGNFHPMLLALSLKKPIFVFNPNSSQFYKLDQEEINKIKARQKAAYVKFLSSDKKGILVSIKPGQLKLREALEIKKRLEKKGGKVYLFLMDNFVPEQLENWPDLAWLNTACPGLNLENHLLDYNLI